MTEARHPVYLSEGVYLVMGFPNKHLEGNVLDAAPQALDNLQEMNVESNCATYGLCIVACCT